jgi:KaiC/GvpD/RAD55 family RecA-like ATPase
MYSNIEIPRTKNGLEVFNDAMMQIMNPPEGIKPSGWDTFSEFTGGLRMHELSIFCANTGTGKTQWLSNLATKLFLQGEKIFIASVETGATDFAARMLSNIVGRDLNTGEKHDGNIFRNKVTPKMMDSLRDNVYFSSHDNRVDVNEMVTTLKMMSELRGVKFAILDNLNFFLKVTRASDVNIAYDEAIHEFVIMSKQLPIHTFLVMHPKKTTGKIESEFDIKGSSTAVQEANNVLLMNRLSEDDLKSLTNHGGPIPPFAREFVFRKIRKRGFYVGKKFYMNYDGSGYNEIDVEDSR